MRFIDDEENDVVIEKQYESEIIRSVNINTNVKKKEIEEYLSTQDVIRILKRPMEKYMAFTMEVIIALRNVKRNK